MAQALMVLGFVLAGVGIVLVGEGISAAGVQILSKSKLEKCERSSEAEKLNCSSKIVLNMAVPSGSSGGEASIVAEIVEVEENSSNKMQALRIPPVITVNKSAAYALYDLTYIRDVPYKPQEFYVKTRKCEPDAGPEIVHVCERLKDEKGNIMVQTQPVCCPCGPQRRMPSSCGNVFDQLFKGKPNTAHCLRFPGDWFHVFGIGQRSLGFSVKIEVRTGSKVSVVTVGPENRTVSSDDNFLRVNLIGDFAGYNGIPSFEDFYLAVPREVGPGQPENLGRNYSMWMLLERVRFTLDGLECNKIGVSYEAFNSQPNFCSSPFWSCLHNQLWDFHEADANRRNRHQQPLYGLEGRFERINQHPNPGSYSFSIGVTETLNTNLMLELRADDIEYVYQRSPGKILNIVIPTFEALTQFGIAAVTSKNTGEVEASYSLTFDCSEGVAFVEEQFFILKPQEVSNQSFKLYPATNQAAKYICTAILKDSQFSEVDRANCQFTTSATVLDNGTQVPSFELPKPGADGFFGSIRRLWNKFWDGLIDFMSGKSCRFKCTSFFDFSCHIQYVCLSWVLLFALLLAIFPTACVLLWLLHQKGLFDPFYDWWDDHFGLEDDQRLLRHIQTRKTHHHTSQKPRLRAGNHHHKHDMLHKHHHHHHRYHHELENHHHRHHHDQLHHVRKDDNKHKHRRIKHVSDHVQEEIYRDGHEILEMGHRRRRRELD